MQKEQGFPRSRDQKSKAQLREVTLVRLYNLKICMLERINCAANLLLGVSRLAGDHAVAGAPGKRVLAVPQPLRGDKRVLVF